MGSDGENIREPSLLEVYWKAARPSERACPAPSSGVHLVAACAHRPGIVVGQRAVARKRFEPEAVHRLPGRQDLPGQMATGDARFTQREICRSIVAKGSAVSSWSRTINPL